MHKTESPLYRHIDLYLAGVTVGHCKEYPAPVFQDYHANNIYQIPLSLTNRSHRFQRLRIVPPSSSQFSITDIKYPNELKGDVAPGMSVTMNVNFNASSLQDFDDLIQVISFNPIYLIDFFELIIRLWQKKIFWT